MYEIYVRERAGQIAPIRTFDVIDKLGATRKFGRSRVLNGGSGGWKSSGRRATVGRIGNPSYKKTYALPQP
jgi:hypothetical protein